MTLFWFSYVQEGSLSKISCAHTSHQHRKSHVGKWPRCDGLVHMGNQWGDEVLSAAALHSNLITVNLKQRRGRDASRFKLIRQDLKRPKSIASTILTDLWKNKITDKSRLRRACVFGRIWGGLGSDPGCQALLVIIFDQKSTNVIQKGMPPSMPKKYWQIMLKWCKNDANMDAKIYDFLYLFEKGAKATKLIQN